MPAAGFLRPAAGLNISDFDLHLNTAGEFELHESVDCLCGRVVDVDETFE